MHGALQSWEACLAKRVFKVGFLYLTVLAPAGLTTLTKSGDLLQPWHGPLQLFLMEVRCQSLYIQSDGPS